MEKHQNIISNINNTDENIDNELNNTSSKCLNLIEENKSTLKTLPILETQTVISKTENKNSKSEKNNMLKEQSKLQRTNSKSKKKNNANLMSTSTELIKKEKNNQVKESVDNKLLDYKNKKVIIKKENENQASTSRSSISPDNTSILKEKTMQNTNSAVLKNVEAEESLKKCNISNKEKQAQYVLAQKTPTKNQLTFNKTIVILPHQKQNKKPPIPQQSSSPEEKSLNDKVERIRINHERINEKIEKIRQDHEKRVNKQLNNSNLLQLDNCNNEINLTNTIENFKDTKKKEKKIEKEKEENKKSEEEKEESKKSEDEKEGKEKKGDEKKKITNNELNLTKNFFINNEKQNKALESKSRQRFKILYRSASSRPVNKNPLKCKIETKKSDQNINNIDQNNNSKNFLSTNKELSFTIPISFYSNNKDSNTNFFSDTSNYTNMGRLSRSTTNVSNILKLSNNIDNIPPFLIKKKDSLTTKFNGPSLRVLQILAQQKETQLKEETINTQSSTNKELTNQNLFEKNQKLTPTHCSRWSTTIENSTTELPVTQKKSIITPLNHKISTEPTNCSVQKRRESQDKLSKKYLFSTFNNQLNNHNDYVNKKKPKYVIGQRGQDVGEMNWYFFLNIKLKNFN